MLKSPNRDLLVLTKNQFLTEQAMEQEVECLNKILVKAECPESFCTAHELVDRNRITQKSLKIIRAIQKSELKPFRFLINKN